MKKFLRTGALAVAAMSASSASAAIVIGDVTGGTSGGIFVEESPMPGFVVGNNNQQSPNLFAFNEVQQFTLTSTIGGLAAGTVVNSHYVFFDPVDSPASRVIGNVTFDGEVLAVLAGRSVLNATDAFLGNSNVSYLNPGARGLEGNDSATFSGNQVFVNFVATSPGDYIRVLTAGVAAVPEPGTWAMMLLGFFGLGAAMRHTSNSRVSTRVRFA